MCIMGIFQSLVGEGCRRPLARRMAARGRVLSTVVCSGFLAREDRAGNYKNADGRWGLLSWLEESGLKSEMEPDELQFLETPAGQADSQMAVNAIWRAEGLGVL